MSARKNGQSFLKIKKVWCTKKAKAYCIPLVNRYQSNKAIYFLASFVLLNERCIPSNYYWIWFHWFPIGLWIDIKDYLPENHRFAWISFLIFWLIITHTGTPEQKTDAYYKHSWVRSLFPAVPKKWGTKYARKG